ncbi:MAG: heparinase II/III domain-containing protein [Emticicia sp.]|uniref:heparinase II/III domain-containing protein n=1 Tax=Emticicia sp. TaxID=1930953 RepID=UPI003BA47611
MNVRVIIVLLLSLGNQLMAQHKPHPYLFYTPESIADVKKRLENDTLLNKAWVNMLQSANKALEGKKGNPEILTLAYCMTGEVKYAERAKELLFDWINKDKWDGLDDRTPRWNSGLGTARGCFQTAIIYDGIYNYLTKEERKKIVEAINKLGIEPALNDWMSTNKRIHSLNSMGHNWWSAVVFEAGIASLAIMTEDEQAKTRIEEIMQASREWFSFSGSILENKPSSFDSNGGFYESVNYANFGVSEYLMFRLAYTNALKPISMPYDNLLQKTVDWFIHTSYPNSKRLMSLNFGDSNDFSNGERVTKLMLALGLGKNYYQWYLNEIGLSEGREDLNINTPLGFLYHPKFEQIKASNPLPNAAMYKDMGWATFRDSWKKDATLLGVKSGYTWNHAHADAGSFVLYHKGQYLLIDGGDVSYGLPEYSSYFVRSEAHNVLLFNGTAQDPQDQYHAVKNPGSLHHLIDANNLKYVLADATGPTSRNFLRNYRNFLWLDKVILILDDVKTYETGKFDFLLHFQEKALKKGPDLEISNNDASILFRPLFPETLPLGYPHDFPEKMKLEERQGIKDRNAKVKIPYFALSPAEKSRQEKFLNAIILLDDSNKAVETFVGSSGANGTAARTNLPIIEKLSGENYIGVRIKQNGKITDVFLNLLADGRLMHRNSNIIINGWETDAYILSVTYPENTTMGSLENVNSFFVSNGSYLRKNEKVYFSSLSKVFMNVVFTNQAVEIEANGQPITNISMDINKKPTKLVINKSEKNINYKNNTLQFNLEN